MKNPWARRYTGPSGYKDGDLRHKARGPCTVGCPGAPAGGEPPSLILSTDVVWVNKGHTGQFFCGAPGQTHCGTAGAFPAVRLNGSIPFGPQDRVTKAELGSLLVTSPLLALGRTSARRLD